MSKYEENEYLDGEDRRPSLIKVLFGILLLIILLVVIVSCTVAKKDSNNFLKTLEVNDGILEPSFNKKTYNYNLKAGKETVYIYCGAESKKASTYGCNHRVNTNNYSTYTIRVKAQNGDYRTYTININSKTDASVISDLKVIINSSVRSGEEVEKAIELKALLSDENTKVSYQWYKNDLVLVDKTTSNITVSESGDYKVKVKDLSTNKEYISDVFKVNIKSADKSNEKSNNTSSNTSSNNTSNTNVLKINSITGNPTSWVSSVTLKVSAYASNGLATNAYSFDGGKTYQKSNSKTFTKNQNVTVVVKDRLGKIIARTITISKIDSTIPSVNVVASSKTNKSVVLTASVSPSSSNSGYKYQWFKNDNIISGATKSTYTATSDGYYRVRVSTNAGKSTTSATYSFKVIKVSAPTIYAHNEAGKVVNPKTWVKGPVYIVIKPAQDVVSYDIYFNESNNKETVSKKFTYFNTFQSKIKLRVSNSGKRAVKIVVRDKYGNTDTYYSKVYYIK